MGFFLNEIMLNGAHDSWWDNKHQYLKLCFDNKGNIQNNSQIWTLPTYAARMTVKRKQNQRLKLYCSGHTVIFPPCELKIKVQF